MKHEKVQAAANSPAFSLTAADLRRAMDRLGHAVDRKAKVPILLNVLIEAGPGGLSLRSTDLDMTIRVDLPDAECQTPGRITVPWRTLRDFSRAASGTVRASVEGTVLRCEADDLILRLNLLCLPEDWPEMAAAPPIAETVMPVSAMHRLVRLARHCISTEETRYYLNGLYFHGIEGRMRVVATDGHRLAVIDSHQLWTGPGMIVPTRAIKAIAALWPKPTDDAITFAADAAGAGRVTVRSGDTTLTTKVIDGTFPDYTRVLPRETGGCGATISAAQIARIGFASSERSRCCRFEPGKDGPGNISVSEFKTSTVQIPADVRGTVPFRINWQYLMKQGRASPVMRLDGGGPCDPLRITGEDPDAFWVIMPMRGA